MAVYIWCVFESLANVCWEIPAENRPEDMLVGLKLCMVRHYAGNILMTYFDDDFGVSISIC